MNNLSKYIIEKLKINSNSKLKSHDNLYKIEHDKIRKELEEYGYHYGSDYDIDIINDEHSLIIYMVENTHDLDELANISDIIHDVLLQNNIDTDDITIYDKSKPQRIDIKIY